jgi:gluconate 2-dehydrogenase gamma chain
MSMGEDNRRMIHIQPVAAQPKAVGPNPVGGANKKEKGAR